MNLLIVAHLVADFLLQPDWIASLKKKYVYGIFIHTLTHAAVLVFFLYPRDLTSSFIIVAIAASHGIVDKLKIHCQDKNRSKCGDFMLDQLIHLIILIIASGFIRPSFPFWESTTGISIIIALLLFGFIFGGMNVTYEMAGQEKTPKPKLVGWLLISLVFILYITTGQILSF